MAVYRGKNIRLTKEPSELMEKLCEPGPSPAEAGLYTRMQPRLYALHAFDKSHILTQVKAGTLAREDAAAMLRVFRNLEDTGGVFERRRDAGDYLPLHSGEAILTETLGREVGGKLHLGRSSGDLSAVSFKMTLRERLLAVMTAANALRRALLDSAEKYAETVMPGYTHQQHAQPTTLGHYFAMWVNALDRDFERFRQFYARLNLSPAGAAILVGSEYGFDRDYEAKLLGFDGVQVNTMDSIWSRDHHAEAYFVLVALFSNIDRLCEDLTLWSSAEYGMLELDDSHCGTSSIMPQKKNPYAAECLKGLSSWLAGAFVQTVMVNKNPSTAAVMEGHRMEEETWRYLDEALLAVQLTADVVEKLVVHERRMLERAAYFWSTAADLAGAMVTECGQTWRAAHQITAVTVRLAIAEGIVPAAADQELLDRASVEFCGSPLGMSTERIRRALDPLHSVRARDMIGGPAPERLREDLKLNEALFASDEAWLAQAGVWQEECAAFMESEIDRLLEG